MKLAPINENKATNNKPTFGMQFNKKTVNYLSKVAYSDVGFNRFELPELKAAVENLVLLKNRPDGLKVRIKNSDDCFLSSFVEPEISVKNKSIKKFQFVSDGNFEFKGVAEYLCSPVFLEEANAAIAERKIIESSDIKTRTAAKLEEVGSKLAATWSKFFDEFDTMFEDAVDYLRLISSREYKKEFKEIKQIMKNILPDKKA